MNIKSKLLELNLVINNEYLSLYTKLIEEHLRDEKIVHRTQIHHIIPRYYYSMNNLKVDNTKANLVNLLFKDHILAHYYLSKCSKIKQYKEANILAIQYMLDNKKYKIKNELDKNILNDIQLLYEELYKDRQYPLKDKAIYDKFLKKVQSESNRNKISNTLKEKAKNGDLFSEEHRKNLSKSASNHIWIHKDNIYTHIPKDELQKYLDNGWIKGGKPLTKEHQEALLKAKIGQKYTDEQKLKLRESHLGQIPWNKGITHKESTKEKLSKYFKGTKWMNNGIISKQVKENEIEFYLKNGFIFGRKKKVIK